MDTGYIVYAKEGQNKGQALADQLDIFLTDWLYTADKRTTRGKDMHEALCLVRQARALIEKHNGFREG